MTNPIQELIKRQDNDYDKKFDWKDCGNFKPKDTTIRKCYICGFDTQFCENCGHDHHIVKKDIAIKDFLSQCRQELLDEVVKMIENELKIDGKPSDDTMELHLAIAYSDGKRKTLEKLLSQLTKLKE